MNKHDRESALLEVWQYLIIFSTIFPSI